MNPTPLLTVEGLRVAFAGREVVHGVSFDIRAGEKLALVGESGSGKTITALSLLGLAQGAHVSGKADFASSAGPLNLLAAPERQLRGIRGQDIAMVFQEPMTALNPVFTIGAQIAEVLEEKQGLAPVESAPTAIEFVAGELRLTPPPGAGAEPPESLRSGLQARGYRVRQDGNTWVISP